MSSESIKVSVVHPNETNGINFYNLLAFWNDTVMGECNITYDSAEQGCLIERLEPAKNYTIVAHSCLIDNSTILRSVEASTTFYLEGELRFSAPQDCAVNDDARMGNNGVVFRRLKALY